MTPQPVQEFPSAADVKRIAALADPVMRNLWITLSYFQLSQSMRVALGSDDLSWCGFATWASKTAGTYIRQDEVPAVINEWLRRAMNRLGPVERLLLHTHGIQKDSENLSPSAQSEFTLYGFARKVIQDVADSIAEGNQAVFADITPPFAEFITLWLRSAGEPSQSDQREFLNQVRSTQENAKQAEQLAEGFAALFVAAKAEPPEKAQLILMSNALIGCAEQKRVQPYLEKSLNCPVADLFLAEAAVFPLFSFDEFKRVMELMARFLEQEFQLFCTEWLLRINLAGQSLRLGQDLPPLSNGKIFPAFLETLADPQPLTLLRELNALESVGAHAMDWVDYAQRMRFIAVMFRSRQQDRSLLAAPFTADQIAELRAGQLPAGDL